MLAAMILLGLSVYAVASLTRILAAEWCEHDDIVLTWEAPDGKNIAIRCKFRARVEDSVMKRWHRHRAGNVRLTGATDRPHILVLGPPGAWMVSRIEANHGYTLDQDPAIEYSPSQSVIFTMSAP
jgi:hypothetical protein